MSYSNASGLKREPVKYIRDRAKSAYVKDKECYICGTNEKLDLHHFASVSQLWRKWVLKNDIEIKNVGDIETFRDQFISEHQKELYEDVRTLCRKHHGRLHDIFGQDPGLHLSGKQRNWCDKQREKIKSKS